MTEWSNVASVLDMDGVILQTNRTKHRAMLALFSSFPDHREQIAQYIDDRNGVRRDLKILGIHSEILRSPLTERELERYLECYAMALEEELARAPLVDGVERFVEDYPGSLFVNSSAPRQEVERQLASRSLTRHFDGIFAGEADKRRGLNSIRALVREQEVVFFGDSVGDWDSARTVGVSFVGVVAERDNFPDAPIAKIRDFVDRATVAEAIEKSLTARIRQCPLLAESGHSNERVGS